MNGHQLVLPLIITYITRHNLMLMFSHNTVFSGVFLKSEILYIVQLCTGMSRIECVIVDCAWYVSPVDGVTMCLASLFLLPVTGVQL